MIPGVRYGHTNLIAEDWGALASFYERLFGCTPVPPERDFRGADLERGTGIPGAHLQGAHLRLPGHGADGPTLEIFNYNVLQERPGVAVNRPGFGHIAFGRRRRAVGARGGARGGRTAGGGGRNVDDRGRIESDLGLRDGSRRQRDRAAVVVEVAARTRKGERSPPFRPADSPTAFATFPLAPTPTPTPQLRPHSNPPNSSTSVHAPSREES